MTVDNRLPDAKLRRFIQARDQVCRFPGCARPAQHCDIDHTIPWIDGGETCYCNLECLCRGHHVQKHHRGWDLTQLPGGVLKWTSPLGQEIWDVPEPVGPVFKPVDPDADSDPENEREPEPAPF